MKPNSAEEKDVQRLNRREVQTDGGGENNSSAESRFDTASTEFWLTTRSPSCLAKGSVDRECRARGRRAKRRAAGL